jgi:hypothetical protein
MRQLTALISERVCASPCVKNPIYRFPSGLRTALLRYKGVISATGGASAPRASSKRGRRLWRGPAMPGLPMELLTFEAPAPDFITFVCSRCGRSERFLVDEN